MTIFSYSTRIAYCIGLIISFASCKKYIEMKTNETYHTINSLSDLQGLLDNTGIMNTAQSNTHEIASDNVFVLAADWTNLASLTHKNSYIWDKDVYNESKNNDWFYLYRTIFYANTVLDNIDRFTASNGEVDVIKASAVFYRAWSLFQAIQIWTAPYDVSRSEQLPGVPLRTNSDFNTVSSRATLEESFRFIMTDLKNALQHLPENVSYKTRPSKAAAYGLLARIHLVRNEFEKAGNYADSALQLNNELLDFNTLSLSSNTPIPRFNQEVIFHATSVNALILNNPRGKVDTALYASYNINDLRRRAYFRAASGYHTFKGTYDGSTALFSGLATDEMYLTKAEALARTGYTTEAIDLLNQLLEKRYITGNFVPHVVANNEEAVALILTERRKELLFRHTRWMDLRRLNFEAPHATTVKRIIGGQTYTLAPGDNKYAFQIPEFIVQNSRVIQNP